MRWPFFRFITATPCVLFVVFGAMSAVFMSSRLPLEDVSSTSQSSKICSAAVSGALSEYAFMSFLRFVFV